MNDRIKILDNVFYFLPLPLRFIVRKLGLYDRILEGKVQDSATLYEQMPEWLLIFQDANYSKLAREMLPHLTPGSVFQIGCGRGDLMRRLAKLGVKPLYGIDRCLGMVRAAQKRLRGYDAQVFHEKAEDFDFSRFAPVSNVIMNNFWGMLSPDASAKLLSRLKNVLAPGGKIIIGDCSAVEKPDHVTKAEGKAAKELGFTLAYPLFMDFGMCGYHSEKVMLDEGEYFVLTLFQ